MGLARRLLRLLVPRLILPGLLLTAIPQFAIAAEEPGVATSQVVDGRCGSSNRTFTSAAPIANLCAFGTASAVSGDGQWRWSCVGVQGGTPASCTAGAPLFPVAVSGRHLVDRWGEPFLIAGESAQAIINISLTGPASMDAYFSNRRAKGFNAVWINMLCGKYTYCPSEGTTYDGIAPFTGMLSGCSGGPPVCYDLTAGNPEYFARIDAILEKAAAYGFLVFLDPISTDGCESNGWMQTLRNNGDARALKFGEFLGDRYKNVSNIVWFSGNDFQCYLRAPDNNLVANVVKGMRSAGDNHLQTSELNYTSRSSKDDTGPLGALMTLNASYSYYPTYSEVLHAHNQDHIPVIMVEANYELENNCCEPGKGPVSMQVLRKQAYWTMLSGAGGQLYGSHYTTGFEPGWTDYLDTPGAAQFGYMRSLFASLPWYALTPDQNHSVMTAGFGAYSRSSSITRNSYATTASADAPNGTFVVAYIPTVRAVTIDMTKLGPNTQAQWYDPTSGVYTEVSGSPFINVGQHSFTPPGNNSSGDSDWVLVLQGRPKD
jgi:Protein of unknown function (DUF4038)/Putative collagen-binding domain of a collagenase